MWMERVERFLVEGVTELRIIAREFRELRHQIKEIKMDLTRITQKVEAIEGVVPSVVALLEEVSTGMRDAAGDQEKINNLADRLESERVIIAAAVAKNSPAEVAVTPAPVPVAAPESTPESAPAPEPAPEQ